MLYMMTLVRLVRLVTTLLGVRATVTILKAAPLPAPPERTPEQLATLINRAARRGPYKATCLQRSLLLWRFVEQAEVHIGVTKAGGSFKSHAWVELEGTVLNDDPAFCHAFEVINVIQ